MARTSSRILPVFSAFAALAFACSTADLRNPAGGGTEPSGEQPGVLPDGGAAPPIDGGRDPGPEGSTPVATSAVSIQVQPTDKGSALLSALRGAKKSVHMTMYLLTDDRIVDALGDLKDAGKDVKVVLNKEFPPGGGSNEQAFNGLKSRGIPVVWAPSAYQFTHAKTIIIDGASLVVMTMNLTNTSAATNREYIATDTDPQDVADAETVFDGDFTNKQTVVASTKLVLSPRSTTSIDARTRLKALIDSAKTSLDVEAQSLSDESIVDAIVLAHQANVAVRVVLDRDTLNTQGQRDAVTKLKTYGVPVRAVGNPDIHAKAMVVDESYTFVGSMNLTPTALVANREVGIVTDAKAEATKVRTVIGEDFAKGTQP
jgi:phosphatidylserine/phosphatidylglycerophosphate/cardiolipin synthase-like enzyme